MSSRVSHALEIFLREQCVDLRLFSISCNLFPLHRLSFSDVPHSRFQVLDLGDPQQVQGFALPKIPSRLPQALKIFLRKNCVDLRLLSTSCSVVPLHALAFSNVPQWRF